LKFLKRIKYKKLVKSIRKKFENLKLEHVNIKDIYQIILPEKDIIFEYFQDYLNFVYNYESGQITTNDDLGKFLEKLLSKEKLNVLEFGTWNGLGSTKIIFQNSLLAHSIEINPFIYSIAKKNLLPLKQNNKIMLGRVINLENTKVNLLESFLSNEFNKERNQIDMWLGHLIHLIFTCESDLITESLNDNYDVLLIDGGGLTTFDEFLVIYKRIHKYIFLDDINGAKAKKILEFLMKNIKYELIFRSKTRNACVFKVN
jgi:hypothetical protein